MISTNVPTGPTSVGAGPVFSLVSANGETITLKNNASALFVDHTVVINRRMIKKAKVPYMRLLVTLTKEYTDDPAFPDGVLFSGMLSLDVPVSNHAATQANAEATLAELISVGLGGGAGMIGTNSLAAIRGWLRGNTVL